MKIEGLTVNYLPHHPKAKVIGLVRVTLDNETRIGHITRTAPLVLTIQWPHAWPTAIAQRLPETAIVREWIRLRRFHNWARHTFNVWE